MPGRRFFVTTSVSLSIFIASFATFVLADEASFFKGKTIRFVVGLSPGGGFDTYTRLIARHFGKHVPGNPQTLVQNMTGAGSLIAANYMYKKAKPDGLTIGNWIGSMVLQEILGNRGTQFKGDKFGWVGVPTPDSNVCALTKQSGIRTIQDWFNAKTPVKIGGTAPGSGTDDPPKLVQAAIGLPIRVISGYGGTAGIRVAADRGEVDGGCWAWESVKVTWKQGIDSGDVHVVLAMTLKPIPGLEDVPLAMQYAKTDESKQLLTLLDDVYGSVSHAYSVPPGVPEQRLKTLQEAFMATMRDPELLSEAKKSNLEIVPLDGPSAAKKIAALYKINSELLDRVKQVILPKS